MGKQQTSLISARVEQGVLVLFFKETDIQDEDTAGELQTQMIEAVQSAGIHRVVLDLERLKYVSSVAFRPLLHLRRLLEEKSGYLVLCNVSKVVGDVFYTTRMVGAEGASGALFVIEADLAGALARFDQQESPPSSV
jgi:anti-anti-sigma factor